MQIIEVVENNIEYVVFYGGRFQPMHKGHFGLFQSLQEKFSPENVFIATTFGNKAQAAHGENDYSIDPFTFEEKQFIMHTMFNISEDHVINTQPYRPDMSRAKRNRETTALILAFSDKDKGRLRPGRVLQEYTPGIKLEPNYIDGKEHRAYIYTGLSNFEAMSGTNFRDGMLTLGTEEAKQKLFTHFFGRFNESVYNLINERLNG
jgi:hypothetical protein|tara:strand:+ start:127 stop:741 length:615 start_codon:yes stop_codon:yes gene_type:complete